MVDVWATRAAPPQVWRLVATSRVIRAEKRLSACRAHRPRATISLRDSETATMFLTRSEYDRGVRGFKFPPCIAELTSSANAACLSGDHLVDASRSPPFRRKVVSFRSNMPWKRSRCASSRFLRVICASGGILTFQTLPTTRAQLGSTAIGVQTKEGVVLGVEKRVTSSLLEPRSIEKIMEIDNHIGCAMSGLTADARTMIDHARVESQVRPLFLGSLYKAPNILLRGRPESLVHLQRKDQSRIGHPVGLRPGSEIW